MAVVTLASTTSLLAVVCWRRRAALALACAIGGLVLALAAAFVSAAGMTLAGSLAAAVIGTILLVLGTAIQRLLDAEPWNDL